MLNFLGPQTVVVNQPVALIGTYDPKAIKTVSVIAEDKYPLDVIQNSRTQTWQVSLDKGFNLAGKRWFRLRGTSSQGQVVSNQTFEVKVDLKGVNIATPFQVIALQETWLKVSPISSSQLNANQKYPIQAGQILNIDSYKVSGNHLQVELEDPLPNVAQSGYFYIDHIVVTKGSNVLWFEQDDLPNPTPGTRLLWITDDTLFKFQPENSALLSPNQQVNLCQGQTLTVLGYACVDNHFRVSLENPMGSVGKSGFVYRYHARLFQADKEVAYDGNATNLTIINTTLFKKKPIDSAFLPESEKVMTPAGMIYGVQSYVMENSHLKVALFENFPGFGNTGYFFPDFIQLTRAGFPVLPDNAPLTYKGPNEVLVKQPFVLRGTFDPRMVAQITLKAEDRYPLNVTLKRSAGIWEVNLANGIQVAGYRWLRLRGYDQQARLVNSQVISLTVSPEPLTAGAELTLSTTKDTLFKVAPFDSGALNTEQKVTIPAGQTFKVLKYGLMDGHLKVLLNNDISPIGSFGYFFPGHIRLKKGQDELKFSLGEVPDTEMKAQMLVTRTTRIKAAPVDTAALQPNQSAPLLLGQSLPIRGYASTQGHFRVTLADSVSGFGNVGYIYWQHVRIVRGGLEILYNPEALTMTVLATTVLKKRPVSSNQLSAAEKTTLPLGRVYGVNSYGAHESNVRVALTEEIPGFGNTGYVYPPHVQFRQGGQTFDPIPPQLKLNVPYFSQRDNPRYSWATCNVTSIAMVMAYYGVRPRFGGQLEDELLEWTLNYAGPGSYVQHNVLSALLKAYGFKSTFSTTRRWYQIKQELISRRPVVLPGDFIVPSGHIVVVIGYNSSGYIVNDPWGDAYTGYTNTYGASLLYSYSYVNQMAGPDGSVWAHFIEPG